MNTFKAWLIANIELIFIVLQIIFFVILGFTFPDTIGQDGEPENKGTIIIGIGIFFAAVLIWGVKSWKSELFFIAIIMAFFLYLLFGKDVEISSLAKIIGTICAVLSLLIGIVLAFTAYRNFDEVVSRRFLFRNSKASVFEVQMKYAFSRFYAGFILTLTFTIEIIAMVVAIRNLTLI